VGGMGVGAVAHHLRYSHFTAIFTWHLRSNPPLKVYVYSISWSPTPNACGDTILGLTVVAANFGTLSFLHLRFGWTQLTSTVDWDGLMYTSCDWIVGQSQSPVNDLVIVNFLIKHKLRVFQMA
jgi:hypothetical protein